MNLIAPTSTTTADLLKMLDDGIRGAGFRPSAAHGENRESGMLRAWSVESIPGTCGQPRQEAVARLTAQGWALGLGPNG